MTPIGTQAWDVDQAALVAILTTEWRQYQLGHQHQREHQYYHHVILLDFIRELKFPPSLTCTYAQNTRAAARIESKSSRKRIFFIFSACVSTKL